MELKIDKVIETVLYVSDIERADAFIERCCNCRRWWPTNAFAPITSAIEAYCCCLSRVTRCAGRTIRPGFPAHDGVGPAHIGLAVAKDQLPHWERHLMANGVEIEGRMRWEHGGRAFIFAIPTPTCWSW